MRELIVLGTGSQAPTRTRNHNGYLLRWDDQGLLFDPGEGTQRQMQYAGVAASDITRLCVTHLHGDHCLGVPGIVQRLSLDQVRHPVTAHYPASGAEYFHRLRYASAFHERATLVEAPVHADGPLGGGLSAVRLDHPVEAFGYRLVEPDGVRMLPEKLAAKGIAGPAVAALIRDGGPLLAEVSEVRRGQRFAFVMDTRLCDGVYALAEGADMLVIESTFLDDEAGLAHEAGHLTARQAARVAAESGVRTLVLTHFSQRYTELGLFEEEARREFSGELHIARDLDRIRVPSRATPTA
ncbi:ribonuclease Z [Longispora fulva]|uniref:Ribonuclease Z n=1 Tax=Longispora fulva TaxID=619741 RepID=A0A8J7GV07_9ACTN|nr:ribonuclease Z [Longispora fulva]MBG6137926.1 ribonuclease Z [Longispora fulva]GIG60179.1 ribonuclease Z [Longispora fulva]